MTDIKLNNSGDITVTSGDITLTSTVQEDARQRTSIRLKTYLNEWAFDRTVGIPYLQQVLKKGADIAAVDTLMKEAILLDPAIEKILEFESDIIDEVYNLRFVATTLSGELVRYAGTSTI